jgi:hypothetical protein
VADDPIEARLVGDLLLYGHCAAMAIVVDRPDGQARTDRHALRIDPACLLRADGLPTIRHLAGCSCDRWPL